jgi:hypothetical protein
MSGDQKVTHDAGRESSTDCCPNLCLFVNTISGEIFAPSRFVDVGLQKRVRRPPLSRTRPGNRGGAPL